MITEDYISYKTAKLLKEKGFDETCRAFWKEWNGEISLCGCNSSHIFEYCHNTMLENYNDSEETNIAAPTLQMAMKWLREVYKLYCDIRAGDNDFVIDIISLKDGEFGCEVAEPESCVYPTYEQACEAGIRYCLENLI